MKQLTREESKAIIKNKDELLIYKLENHYLSIYLKDYILKSLKKYYIDIKQFHHHAITGLIKILSSIMITSLRNPKIAIIKHHQLETTFERIKGWHIYSSDIKILARNKICQELSKMKFKFERYHKETNTYLDKVLFFISKPNDSTYHSNNSRNGNNGYSHHYIFTTELQKISNIKKYHIEQFLEHKFLKHDEKDKKLKTLFKEQNITKIVEEYKNDKTSFFLIEKKIFMEEYNDFLNYHNPKFSTVIDNVIFIENNHVMVNNRIENKKIHLDDKWEENILKGREYSVIGTLEKSLRNRIFNFIEYDVSVCLQTILLNLYYKSSLNEFTKHDFSSLKIDFPFLYKLLTNKKELRERIAFLFDTDAKTAKKIITHLTNSPTINYMTEYGRKLTSLKKKRTKKEMNHIIKELKKLKKKVLEKYYYYDDINSNIKIGDIKIIDLKNLINDDIEMDDKIKKRDGRGKKFEDRILYRLNIIIEHQIRTKMIEYSKINGCKTQIFQIHDCILSTDFPNISTDGMSKYIKNELGLIVNFEKTNLHY